MASATLRTARAFSTSSVHAPAFVRKRPVARFRISFLIIQGELVNRATPPSTRKVPSETLFQRRLCLRAVHGNAPADGDQRGIVRQRKSQAEILKSRNEIPGRALARERHPRGAGRNLLRLYLIDLFSRLGRFWSGSPNQIDVCAGGWLRVERYWSGVVGASPQREMEGTGVLCSADPFSGAIPHHRMKNLLTSSQIWSDAGLNRSPDRNSAGNELHQYPGAISPSTCCGLESPRAGTDSTPSTAFGAKRRRAGKRSL